MEIGASLLASTHIFGQCRSRQGNDLSRGQTLSHLPFVGLSGDSFAILVSIDLVKTP
jgi:hypothetical protein